MSKRNRNNEKGKGRGANTSRKSYNTGFSRQPENRNDSINRQYKDRLFRALFGSPERKDLTLELYNAMNGSSYTDPEEIKLSTIDDVVYMGMRNDVSFLFGQTMHLWEQQSTRNPNMPLRYLLYYAHVMESYVHEMTSEDGDIYSSSLVQIPTPRMVLFYNGPGRLPEHMYLSRAYVDGTDPDVEARVRVININSGQDRILALCRPLQDYTTFVETFRMYRERGDISDRAAASRAIEELPDGAVKDYLRAHEAQVVDMLLTEYNEEKTLKAEYYAGMKAEQERSLRMLCSLVAQRNLAIDVAVMNAAAYGITDEADFRKRAADLGFQLPVSE